MRNILCILGIIISSTLVFLSDYFSLKSLYIPWALVTIVVAFIVYSDKKNLVVKDFWLRPSIICFLSIIIVGYQLCIDDVLGFSSIENSIFTGASRYADCCFFSASAFIFAYLIGLSSKAQLFISRKTIIISEKTTAVWLALMILSFVLFISSIDINYFLSGAVYHGSGAADYNYTISNSYEGLYQTLFYITLAGYTLLISQKQAQSKTFAAYFRGIPLIFWICVSLFLILRLFSGDRGPVIYGCLAIVYAYIWFSKVRFKFFTVVIALIIGASFVSFWGTYRMRSTKLSIFS